jgi:hypothetical protein
VSALAPAVAGDALCYHLELPKQFLAAGRIEFLPLHENSTFPLLAEMWYLWALSLDTAVAAQLVHWGLGLLLAGASVLLARPVVGRRAAWLAGAVVLTVPGVTNQMTAPLNDAALAAFSVLALVAWIEATRPASGRNSASGRREPADPSHASECSPLRWSITAGVMTGAALSIKYVAFLFAAAVGMAACWTLLRRVEQRGRMLRGAAVVATIAVLFSAVWYARAAYHRGNPVYPFFSHVLGGDGRPTVRESKRPLKWNVSDFLHAPWQLTMNPEQFGGRGHQLGCLFLMVAPAALFVRRRRLRWLLSVAAVYALLWYALRQNVRFLLPVVPILAVAATAVLCELRRWPWPPRAAAVTCSAAVIALCAAIPLYRARQHVQVALGLERRDAFLRRHEPTYRAACFVNESLPSEAHVLSQDHRAFYFHRAFTRENAFRRATAYSSRLEGPGELASVLRAEGFTHLLIAETDGAARYNDTLRRLADDAQAAGDRRLQMRLTYEFREPGGPRTRYRLIELRNDDEPADATLSRRR